MYRIAPIPMMVLLFSGAALAWNPNEECPTPPEDSHRAQITAGELFNKADQAYAAGRPLDALESFLCAHHVVQHENTLFNIAQISKINEIRAEALEILKAYVQHTTGANRVDPIQDIIHELEEQLMAEGALSPAEGPLEPDTAGPEASAAENVPEQSGRSKRKPLKIAGISLLGVGGAGLVVGAILQGLAGGAQSSAEESTTYPDFKSERDRMKGLQAGALAGFIAGGVLAGTGLALVLIGNKGSEKPIAAKVHVAPTPNGLRIEGRF